MPTEVLSSITIDSATINENPIFAFLPKTIFLLRIILEINLITQDGRKKQTKARNIFIYNIFYFNYNVNI